MGASDFANLPHIGEAVRRKEDYRFLTGAGQYTDDINLANQKRVEVLCHEAVLIPSGELDLAGQKFITFGLSGTLITPSGESGPLNYREID